MESTIVINLFLFRETAPSISTSDMFGNNSDLAFQVTYVQVRYYDQRRVVKRRVDKQRVDKQRVDKRRVDNKRRVVTNVGYITNTG